MRPENKEENKQKRIREESLGMPYYSSNLVRSNTGFFSYVWLAMIL